MAVSDLFAPISGVVMEVNELLTTRPEVVNSDCYGEGWILRLELSDDIATDSLLDADAYAKHIADLGD